MAIGFPDWSLRQYSSAYEEEQQKASVTATASDLTFTTTVHSWRLYNDGPNACYYAIGETADTDNFKIPAKSWIMEDAPVTVISLVCAAGETATVYAVGLR